MKRLTPEQVASGYAKTPGAPSAKSLWADHFRAKKDVEQLSAMLARVLTQLPAASLVDAAEALLAEVSQ